MKLQTLKRQVRKVVLNLCHLLPQKTKSNHVRIGFSYLLQTVTGIVLCDLQTFLYNTVFSLEL